MTEPFDPRPPDAKRMMTRAAVIYALVAVLFLAACCVGAIWFSGFLKQVVAELT